MVLYAQEHPWWFKLDGILPTWSECKRKATCICTPLFGHLFSLLPSAPRQETQKQQPSVSESSCLTVNPGAVHAVHRSQSARDWREALEEMLHIWGNLKFQNITQNLMINKLYLRNSDYLTTLLFLYFCIFTTLAF